MKQLFFIISIFSLCGLSSCDLINPEEEIPAYIYIEEFSFSTDIASEGSASTKITEGWLSVGGDFLGAYSLPALVPVLAKGNQMITINPGIKDNGIISTPEIYPFYDPFVIEVELEANVIDTIRPNSGYLDNVQFAFVEDFERENHVFQDDLDGNEGTRIVLTDEEVFEGNFSGQIRLDRENAFIEVATLDRYRDLISNGAVVYLEVNYKSEVPVLFGLVGHEEGIFNQGLTFYDPGFTAKDEWNKIFFNMTPLIFENNFPEYQFSIQTILPIENGDFTMENANIWLDNIKLLHF